MPRTSMELLQALVELGHLPEIVFISGLKRLATLETAFNACSWKRKTVQHHSSVNQHLFFPHVLYLVVILGTASGRVSLRTIQASNPSGPETHPQSLSTVGSCFHMAQGLPTTTTVRTRADWSLAWGNSLISHVNQAPPWFRPKQKPCSVGCGCVVRTPCRRSSKP